VNSDRRENRPLRFRVTVLHHREDRHGFRKAFTRGSPWIAHKGLIYEPIQRQDE
jgi:hypothetical protein